MFRYHTGNLTSFLLLFLVGLLKIKTMDGTRVVFPLASAALNHTPAQLLGGKGLDFNGTYGTFPSGSSDKHLPLMSLCVVVFFFHCYVVDLIVPPFSLAMSPSSSVH